MRWENLFADLEARLAAAERAELTAEVAELTRAERAAVTLVDRLRAAEGAAVALTTIGGARVAGTVVGVGPAWVLVADGPRRHLVPLAALATLAGLAREVAAPVGMVESRLGLGHALRAVSRDRALVRVGHRAAVTGQVIGRIDVVGADHVEVAVAGVEDSRPTGERVVVPVAALEFVSSG